MTVVEPPKAGFTPPRVLSDTAWAKRRAPSFAYIIVGAIPGFVAGMIVSLFFMNSWYDDWMFFAMAGGGALITSVYTMRHAWAFVCTQCGKGLPSDFSTCPGCHAVVRGRVTEADLRRMAEEDLDRRAAEDGFYEECPDCKPEEPCERHPLEEMTLEDFEN
jgi:hypothetical protein